MIKINLKNKSKGFRSGFVILFAVTLSAILLSIALGVSSIALQEIKFGTDARDTNDAFFAADTGIECAFLNEKGVPGTVFVINGSDALVSCMGASTTAPINGNIWTFNVSGLGSTGKSCAEVTVNKSTIDLAGDPVTIITSNGYSKNEGATGCTPGLNAVERQIESRY